MEKDFEREVLERLTKIETKLDDYNNIRDKTEEAYSLSKENEKDINDINDKIKWLSRTIAGAIITGVIGIIFVMLQKYEEFMNKKNFKEWWVAALKRAIRTFAQAVIGVLGTNYVRFNEVDWVGALSIGLTAFIISILMSISGLPEVKEWFYAKT